MAPAGEFLNLVTHSGSGSFAVRHAGSSPASRTIFISPQPRLPHTRMHPAHPMCWKTIWQKTKKEAAGKMRGKPCHLKEGANWRREWELNPPEPVLQTVALAARPSRHCKAIILLYPGIRKNQVRNRFFTEKTCGRGGQRRLRSSLGSNTSFSLHSRSSTHVFHFPACISRNL